MTLYSLEVRAAKNPSASDPEREECGMLDYMIRVFRYWNEQEELLWKRRPGGCSCTEGMDLTDEELEDMKKYFEYLKDPENPQLKEFGERYREEFWEARRLEDRRQLLSCLVNILVAVILLHWLLYYML